MNNSINSLLEAAGAKKNDRAVQVVQVDVFMFGHTRHRGRFKAVGEEMSSRAAAQVGPNIVKHCRYGLMVYNKYDEWVGRSLEKYGEYGQAEADLLHRNIRAGDVIVEVGANIGSHTVGLAKKVGPGGVVIAFEPQEIVFQTLCGNVAINGLLNVKTFHKAVGNENASISVPVPDYEKTGNFGGISLGGGNKSQSMVQLVRLDDFMKIKRCRLLKIDVEGIEAEVIRGAEKMIRTLRPIIYVENDRREKSAELIELIFSLGYTPFWHLPRLFNPNNYFENPINVFQTDRGTQYLSVNMLCAPPGVSVFNMENARIRSPSDWWREE